MRENSKREHEGQDYFAGEVEPCITGLAAAIGSYFGEDVRGIVDRLLGEQLSDGGWNCEAENGSTRSSFNTTFGVLEGLLYVSEPEFDIVATEIAATLWHVGVPAKEHKESMDIVEGYRSTVVGAPQS